MVSAGSLGAVPLQAAMGIFDTATGLFKGMAQMDSKTFTDKLPSLETDPSF